MSAESKIVAEQAVVTLTPGDNGQPPLVTTAQLFKDQNTLRIAHEGNLYLLRITRENKLILTK